MAACPAFYKESRMKFVDPPRLTGNPGGWGTRRFVALRREFMRAVFTFLGLSLLAAAGLAAPAASAGTQLMYLGVWPHTVLVMDSVQGKIVDKIDLPTDIARTLVLSPDNKKLYASTLKDNSIVTIDLASRKVIDSFPLNTYDTNYRLAGFAVDPTGQFLYTFATPVIKKIDHYEIDPSQIVEISLAARKITRIVPYPKDEPPPAGYRNTIRVSPDGKLLYLFRDSIMVFNTSDFKFVKKIELSKPTDPSTDGSFAGLVNDPNEPPGKVVGIFDSSDPYVHRRTFGIAEVDLSNLTYDLTPVGPSAAEMEPLMLTPDRKLGYTVSVYGSEGDRVTEFWVFDMKTKKIINRRQFVGRTRLAFGMTADGSKLMIYNAGFEIELYDAKTLELLHTINLEGDTTSNLVVMPLKKSA
jgi:YVTN family beta-propeller protein